MKVIWTHLAKITYIEILENLQKRWTQKEVKEFNILTNAFILKIQDKNITHPYANKKLSIRKGKIHKNVSLYYKEDLKNQVIYLITFFNNRMDPTTLKKLLRGN